MADEIEVFELLLYAVILTPQNGVDEDIVCARSDA